MINRPLLASHNKKFFSHTFKRLLLSVSKTTISVSLEKMRYLEGILDLGARETSCF
jgi:hypothetical protein